MATFNMLLKVPGISIDKVSEILQPLTGNWYLLHGVSYVSNLDMA